MNQAARQDFGKLVLRIALGALILLHGISKLKTGLGPIEGMVVSYALPGSFAYGALIGEVLAPLMLLFVFSARLDAIIVAINILFVFGMASMGPIRQLNVPRARALHLKGMVPFTPI